MPESIKGALFLPLRKQAKEEPTMTAHTRQPLHQRPATRARPMTFTEARSQLNALNVEIAEGTRQAQELTARVARFEEATVAKPRVKTKADYYEEMVSAATRRFGELSPEQAVSALTMSHSGGGEPGASLW